MNTPNNNHRSIFGFSYTNNVLLIIALVAIVAIAAWFRPNLGREPVALQVDTPDFLFVGPEDVTVPVEVTLRLTNSTDDAVVVSADNNCRIFRWVLLDQSDSMTQTYIEEGCGSTEVTDVIDAGSTLTSQTTLILNAARVPPGRRYRLLVRYWGYEAETAIRVRERRDDS